MSQKKTPKTKKDCKCGHEQLVEQDGYFNWKCEKCGKINPFNKIGVGVVWKCDPGTARRNG